METQILLDAVMKTALAESSAIPFEDAAAILPTLKNQDLIAEREYARYIRDIAADKVLECCSLGKMDDADRIMSCIEDICFGAVTY